MQAAWYLMNHRRWWLARWFYLNRTKWYGTDFHLKFDMLHIVCILQLRNFPLYLPRGNTKSSVKIRLREAVLQKLCNNLLFFWKNFKHNFRVCTFAFDVSYQKVCKLNPYYLDHIKWFDYFELEVLSTICSRYQKSRVSVKCSWMFFICENFQIYFSVWVKYVSSNWKMAKIACLRELKI